MYIQVHILLVRLLSPLSLLFLFSVLGRSDLFLSLFTQLFCQIDGSGGSDVCLLLSHVLSFSFDFSSLCLWHKFGSKRGLGRLSSGRLPCRCLLKSERRYVVQNLLVMTEIV